MKLIQKTKNIFQVEAKSQYDLAMTFIRLQEFYESPFKEFRGHTFILEAYMDRYAQEYGNFTYSTDWNGFNVPGNIVRKFFSFNETNFMSSPSFKERWLHTALINTGILRSEKDFYLLGTHTEKIEKKEADGAISISLRDEALDHELAHAFWYLDSDYQKAQIENLAILSKKTTREIHEALEWLGYAEEVFSDEAQAYLSTSDSEDLEDSFEGNWPNIPKKKWKVIKDFYNSYRTDVAKI